MERIDLARSIYSASYSSRNPQKEDGLFEITSSQLSKDYLDKYQFATNPQLLRAIIENLNTMIPHGTQVLAGVDMGGVPIATALSIYRYRSEELELSFVRENPKSYGLKKRVEGAEVFGKKVCVVDDVVTSGKQSVETTLHLRELKANVEYVLCVLERDGEARKNLAGIGVTLVALFKEDEIRHLSNSPTPYLEVISPQEV